MTLEQYLKTRKKTHIIFDLDETLVHLILPWHLWEKDIKNKLIKVDRSIYEKYKNHQINLSQLENAYISKYPQTKDLIIKNSINFETENLKDIRVNQELINFIKKARDCQIFLWSGNTRPIIEKVFKKLKILNKFNKLVTRLDVDLLKPEPEGFYKIYDPKVPKEKYIFIGNSSYDKQAAKSSGIDFYKEDYFK